MCHIDKLPTNLKALQRVAWSCCNLCWISSSSRLSKRNGRDSSYLMIVLSFSCQCGPVSWWILSFWIMPSSHFIPFPGRRPRGRGRRLLLAGQPGAARGGAQLALPRHWNRRSPPLKFSQQLRGAVDDIFCYYASDLENVNQDVRVGLWLSLGNLADSEFGIWKIMNSFPDWCL